MSTGLYLTRDELAELVDCSPRSISCMCRWLERNHWPYSTTRAGVPRVARQYFVDRMTGRLPPAVESKMSPEPDFAALDR
ncbi:DUF4224 domain-containing protein [Burkholderia gladioli]|uniref:DUF4224 domain-containing protein n=1 Tax=Burkholderia gladioli TaxID=28095 RepID=UPI00163E60F1|nr:DUF4224 domain-containing protein [Burkholderia gladioli]